ncbi:MAG: hypothetical protein ABL952_17770, partial [Pyrinomonadaceae bacterium]
GIASGGSIPLIFNACVILKTRFYDCSGQSVELGDATPGRSSVPNISHALFSGFVYCKYRIFAEVFRQRSGGVPGVFRSVESVVTHSNTIA